MSDIKVAARKGEIIVQISVLGADIVDAAMVAACSDAATRVVGSMGEKVVVPPPMPRALPKVTRGLA